MADIQSKETRPKAYDTDSDLASAIRRRRELGKQLEAESAIVVDRATTHLETQLRLVLRLQRRLVEKTVARFLEPCRAFTRLHDRLRPLLVRQSAWWTLDWNPTLNRPNLSLVALPPAGHLASQLAAAAGTLVPLLGQMPPPYEIDAQLDSRADSSHLGCYNKKWITDAGFGPQSLMSLSRELLPNLIRQMQQDTC